MNRSLPLPALSRLSRSAGTYVRSRLPKLRRLFWLIMVVGHAHGLVGAWRSSVASGFDLEPLGGCILLLLSMLFFVLKLGDVAFLRFRADRRSFVAFCVVVAFLHLGVLRPGDDPTLIPEYTALAATTWLASGLLLRSRTPRESLARTETPGRHGPSMGPRGRTIWLDAFRPHCWILAFRVFNLRAPPA